MSRLLELEGVEASYGAIRALEGVSLAAEEGSVVGVLGPNGAGKSTLLRCIMGLHRPSRGEVRFRGQRITGLPPHRIARMGVAMVPERRELFEGLTVGENLQLGGYTQRDPRRLAAGLEHACELFPVLRDRYSERAGNLSGGQQQMLAIARGMVASPTLLLLDEPSLGLAPRLVTEVFDRIAEIIRLGVTVVVVEQNATMALSIARYGYVLDHGRVELSGPADELASDDRVRRSYLGRI